MTVGSSSQTSHNKNSPFQCDPFNNDALYCKNSTEAGSPVGATFIAIFDESLEKSLSSLLVFRAVEKYYK